MRRPPADGRRAGPVRQAFARDSRAVAAIEFALILPIFLVMIFSMIYVGLYVSVAHSLAEVAADSARYAMVGLDADERRQLAHEWLTATERRYGLVDCVAVAIETAERDGALTVSAAYDITFLPKPPIIAALFAPASTIRRSTTVMVP